MKKKVGIIGNGFVGEAQAFAFAPVTDLRIYDLNKLKSTHSKKDIDDCEFVFVCVPTPMRKNGSQDLSYIYEVFESASEKPIYIIKSTVVPGTTKTLSAKFTKLKIVFSPEFLTERTSKLDMLTQSRVVIGSENAQISESVKLLYNKRFMNRNIIETNSITAEFIKYMNNTFFATKVSIMNEFKLLGDKIGVDWIDALNGFASDGRVGDSHLHVPGPDGKLGYGGTCFPKDVNALLNYAKLNKINLNTIEGGWKTNLEIRPERDWEKSKGRAVSDN